MAFVSSGFPEIRAIFLAQFHPDQGPIVRLSVPEDAVDSRKRAYGGAPGDSGTPAVGEGDGPQNLVRLVSRPASGKPAVDSNKIDFNSIETTVIPKLTLFERLITVNTGRFKVMCYPIAVEGNYARNELIFNMCFAFDIDADTVCYGPVVKRVGCLLKDLETTGRLLSDPDGARPLKTMMRQLVNNLNNHGEYQIELDLKGLLQPIASTGFSIKLFPYYKAPRDIRPFDVPVKLVDFELAKSKSAQTVYQKNLPGDILWDLVLERVTTCIDNVNHVRRIARLAQMEEETVVLALKHLDYYGCIALVDIFKFSNIYEAQHQMRELLRDPNLQRECLEYVTGGGHGSSDVQLEELLRLYTTLQQRRTVAEWVVDNGVGVDRLDVRRFVVFGVIHGLLRRVHRYPILSEPRPRSEDESAEPDVGLEPRILGMLDGAHPLDEISVASGLDAVTLRGKFSLHGKVEYMYM